MTALGALLNRLRSRLDGEGVPFVVGGSFALAARGHPRYTDDIDIMVLSPDLAPVHRAFHRDEFETVNEVTFRDVATGLTVDVIPVEDDAQRWAFSTATPETIQGARAVRVLTAEGLALMLLREATRGDPRRRPLRLRDIETLAVNEDVDLREIAPWVKRMGYEQAWRALDVKGKPAT
jgi:hypothetical protein